MNKNAKELILSAKEMGALKIKVFGEDSSRKDTSSLSLFNFISIFPHTLFIFEVE